MGESDEIIFTLKKQTLAVKGQHGKEGAYVAAKIDGELIGAPDRAPSHLSNPWESFNARRDKNYTYYIPVKEEFKGEEYGNICFWI